MTRRVKIAIAVPSTVLVTLMLLTGVGMLAGCGSGDSGATDSGGSAPEPARAQEAVDGALDQVTGSDAGAASKSMSGGGALAEGDFSAAVPPASAPSNHYLVRTGDLSLLVARGRLLSTVDRIKATTATLGGYVMSSSLGTQSGIGAPEPMPLDDAAVSSSGDVPSSGVAGTQSIDGDPYASIVVRVPEQLFDTAVKRFSRLGEVQSASTSSEDVTSQYVDLRARLRHFRAVERRLVGFLDETTTVNQMLAVQDRIDEVQLTIEELSAQLKSLRETTTYGTLSVYVSERDGTPATIQSSNTFGGTLSNSIELLGRGIRVTGLVLTALAPFIVVFGVVAAIVWYVVRRVRRSRRRAAPPAQPA
jgi:hypothetical protein